jgi:hypothetical protein
MRLRISALVLGLLVSGLVAGCGEEASRWTTNSKALDEMVLALRSDISIEAVRAELGRPRLEMDLGEEETLHYGLWQLVFIDGYLDSRTRYYTTMHQRFPPWTLDRKVRKFRRGMSIKVVRSILGKPEALQVFKNAPGKEVSLWYPGWELGFTAGKLEIRTRWG